MTRDGFYQLSHGSLSRLLVGSCAPETTWGELQNCSTGRNTSQKGNTRPSPLRTQYRPPVLTGKVPIVSAGFALPALRFPGGRCVAVSGSRIVIVCSSSSCIDGFHQPDLRLDGMSPVGTNAMCGHVLFSTAIGG